MTRHSASFLPRSFFPTAHPEQLRGFNELQRLSTSPENAARIMDVSSAVDVSGLLPKVSVPTLVIHTREDARVPFEEARLMASLIPNARFVPLEGRNHVLLESEPPWPRFLEEVRAFLGDAAASARPFPALTAREKDVLEIVSRGLANQEIAERLGISHKTVRNHVSALFDKLGVFFLLRRALRRLESSAKALVFPASASPSRPFSAPASTRTLRT